MAGHGGSCGCEHKHQEQDIGDNFTLYTKIDLQKLQCLNEEIDGSGKDIFKPFDLRLDNEKVRIIAHQMTCHIRVRCLNFSILVLTYDYVYF